MNELLNNFADKVSQALSRPVHILIWEDKLNYFKFLSVDFKNSFCLGSLDYFGSLECRIGECPFRYVLILFLGSVKSAKIDEVAMHSNFFSCSKFGLFGNLFVLVFWCLKSEFKGKQRILLVELNFVNKIEVYSWKINRFDEI